jgi:WD40 repeat protein
MQHNAPIDSATFSDDGRRILTASRDSTTRIWEAATGAPLGAPLKHSAGVVAAIFAPGDDRHIVTVSSDGTARVRSILLAHLETAEKLRLADLAEVVGGLRLNNLNVPVPLSDKERATRLRRLLARPDATGRLVPFDEFLNSLSPVSE